MTKKPLFFLLLILLSSCSATQQTNQAYSEVSLDSNWMFQKGGQRNEKYSPKKENWQLVDLPHTTRVENKVITPNNQQWQGIAYYQKSLFVPASQSGNRVYIEFGAAMNTAKVYLNNKLVGLHEGGYLPFTFDITENVQFGEQNILLVKLNNMDSDITGPKPLDDLDFIMYGGLYRNAKLIFKPQLHISYPLFGDKPQSGGVFVKSKNIGPDFAEIDIKTHINNQSANEYDYQVLQEVFVDENVVKSAVSNHIIGGRKDYQVTNTIGINNPRLWHPNSPQLYMLRTSLIRKGKILQVVETVFGIRKFHFNSKNELFINDEKTVLRGVNYHQDYPYVGYAKSKQAELRDAKLIKEAGFNFVRLSHYPHSPYFLEAANKLGLVILNPMLGWQYYQAMPKFEQNAFQRCRDLIRRDRNHPSVLAWECSLNETDMPKAFVDKLQNIVKAEYPESYSAGWMDGYDIYIQARQHKMKHPDEIRPNKPYIISEYGDWEYFKLNAGKDQQHWDLLPKNHRDSRQLIQNGEKRLQQQATNIHEAHVHNLSQGAIADAYWVMFDYNRGKFTDIESSGLGSIDRLPKYSYFYFQSQRSPTQESASYIAGPMVYIASDWTPNSNNLVTVFSNTNNVKLLLNGIEQPLVEDTLLNTTKIKGVKSPMYFDVESYVPGKLEAFAYVEDEIVASHKVETPGKVSRILINIADQAVPIGVNDTVFVNATLVDEKGINTLVNGAKIKFYATAGVEILNPENNEGIVSTRGVSVALIKTSMDFERGSIWAELIGNDMKSSTVAFEVDAAQPSQY